MSSDTAKHGVTEMAPHAPARNETSPGKPVTARRASRAGHGIGTLGMIWAADRHGVLGANGGMLWRVPADFAHFKQTTLGHPVIMGRTSFEALGAPLPGRRNIVLTRSPSAVADFMSRHEIETADSVAAALELCAGSQEVWITGGGAVYQEVMDAGIADLLVVSELDLVAPVPAGAKVTKAPRIDPALWRIDAARSDTAWRPVSGDAAWRVEYYLPR